MTFNLKHTLLAGTALVAVSALVVPQGALAGNSANLVIDGGGAAAVPPAAGETLEIQDNTTNAIWDADDGGGSATSDIEFLGGGGGVSSVLLEDSTGAGPIIVNDIYVTDDAQATTLNIDATNGDVNVQVVGDVRNDDGAGTDLAIILTDGANGAVLSFNGGAAQAVAATIDGLGAAEGALVIDNAIGVTFAEDVGANNSLASVDVYADSIAVFNGALEAGSINLLADSTTTFNDDVVGDVELNSGAVLNLSDGVEIDGEVDATAASVGTLNFAGNGNVTGVIGATESLAAINLNGAGGTTVSFQDNVSADLVTIGAGNLSLMADLTGDVHFDDDGTLLFNDDGTVTGNITVETGGDGEVLFLATTTITGTVGEADARVGTITGPTGVDIGTFESSVFADLITVDAGDLVFEDTVDATDITFGNTGEVTFEGNVTSANGIDFGDNAGTVNFADNADMDGDILNGGNVTFAGSSTVTGNLGQGAGDELVAVTATGGAGETVEIDGDVILTGDITVGAGALTVSGDTSVDDINVGAGSVTLDGEAETVEDIVFTADGTITFNDATTIGDDVLAGADGRGTVVMNADATITGDVGTGAQRLKAFTVGGTGTTITVNNDFFAADTTTIDGNTIDVTGVVNIAAGQILNADITGATTSGSINATGVATVNSAALLNIDVTTTGYIANNQAFTIVSGQNAGGAVDDLADGNITVTGGSRLLSFVQDTDDDDNLVLLAERVAMNTLAVGSNNLGVGQVLEDLGNDGDDDLDDIQGNLQGAGTEAELNEMLESLTPTVDGGAIMAGFNASVESLDVNRTRLASLQDGTQTGMSAGNMGKGTGMWVQGFGQYATQDRRGGIDGYDADTYGMAVGVDTQNILDKGTVGVAVSYANTDVNSDNANRTDTDIDSYQLSLYGDYTVAPATRVSAMTAFAYNDIDHTRHDVGGLGTDVTADYDSQQYIAYVDVERDFAVAERTTLTPGILAHYQHINIDSYTESGAGGLSVDTDDMDIFELGVGAELAWDLEDGSGGKVRPAINVGYRYDLVGDNIESTSNFTGGGASFRTEGADPARSTFNIGASIAYATVSNWTLSADYDYEIKSDYDAHSAALRAGLDF